MRFGRYISPDVLTRERLAREIVAAPARGGIVSPIPKPLNRHPALRHLHRRWTFTGCRIEAPIPRIEARGFKFGQAPIPIHWFGIISQLVRSALNETGALTPDRCK